MALETTLITHGFPAPEGLAVALELERVVRDRGAIPATIGVLGGVLRVGLTEAELETLAASKALKLNLSNLSAGLAQRSPGSTTVAATMFAASRAGIRVFATGGIGGVHRESDDVSGDLVALARYPVAVVSAGAKALLDLPRTIEMLETFNVPVLGYGTDEFPAFYRRSSGLPVDCRLDSIAALAEAVRIHLDLEVAGGIVVANPIPPQNEMPLELYERSIAASLADAEKAQVRGRDLTPFLLDRVRDRTEGKSVFSNRALLQNNVEVAADLAVALAAHPSASD